VLNLVWEKYPIARTAQHSNVNKVTESENFLLPACIQNYQDHFYKSYKNWRYLHDVTINR